MLKVSTASGEKAVNPGENGNQNDLCENDPCEKNKSEKGSCEKDPCKNDLAMLEWNFPSRLELGVEEFHSGHKSHT